MISFGKDQAKKPTVIVMDSVLSLSYHKEDLPLFEYLLELLEVKQEIKESLIKDMETLSRYI